MYIMIIEADTNDGDYIYKFHEVTDEMKESFEIMYQKLKDSYKTVVSLNDQRMFADRDIPEVMYKDILNEEEINYIRKWNPFNEFGIHTIESVKFYKITSDTKDIKLNVRWYDINC